jgi:lincosamide nucleotidyltransferase A/C/D/E
MTSADVLHVLDLLAAVGVPVWVDGGWGVDALLGEQTRLHDDLDLALEHRDLAGFLHAMGDSGFRLLRDDGPFNKVLVDEAGREVDYHVFDASATRRTEAGVTAFGPMGLEYEVGAFEGRGTILGRPVVCCTVEFQVRSHTGYELDEDDLRDVEALHRRFGLPLLPEHVRPR